MNANLLIKSLLHLIAGIMTIIGMVLLLQQKQLLIIGWLIPAGITMFWFAWKHSSILGWLYLRTSWLLVFDAVVLAGIAWHLYRQGYHKATFLYEGVSIFYFSIAAFVFLLRKKRAVFFGEEETK